MGPLLWLGYRMAPELWLVAARRRLGCDVYPKERSCLCCKFGVCDVKGEPSVMCPGAAALVKRHDSVRDMIAKAAREAGFTVSLEHGGDLNDSKRRPGDVCIYNWNGCKHLLIDVAIINPQAEGHRGALITGGAGAAATKNEAKKWAKYLRRPIQRILGARTG